MHVVNIAILLVQLEDKFLFESIDSIFIFLNLLMVVLKNSTFITNLWVLGLCFCFKTQNVARICSLGNFLRFSSYLSIQSASGSVPNYN